MVCWPWVACCLPLHNFHRQESIQQEIAHKDEEYFSLENSPSKSSKEQQVPEDGDRKLYVRLEQILFPLPASSPPHQPPVYTCKTEYIVQGI